MASSGSNALRMAGINSGFDTEAMVNAMTALTKNKINTNERTVMKLEAQQEAYRSVITAMTAFQDKYFDVLNQDTYLQSSTIFNDYTSKLSNAAGTAVNGVTVTSNAFASAATYEITVNNAATQSTLTSSPASSGKVNVEHCTDNAQQYTMQITYAGETKNIYFNGGSEEDVRSNINEQLRTAFGTTDVGNKNIVSIGSDNKIATTDKSAVTTTPATIYAENRSLGISDIKTGANTFTVTVDGVSKTVSVSTLADDYFSDIFEEDGTTIKADADEAKVSFYNNIKDAVYDDAIRTEYEDKVFSDEDKEQLYQNYADKKNTDLHDKVFADAKQAAYDAAVESGTTTAATVDEFGFSETDFEASDLYSQYTSGLVTNNEAFRTEENLYQAYKALDASKTQDEFLADFTTADLVSYANNSNLNNTLGSLKIGDTTFSLAYGKDADNNLTIAVNATDKDGNAAKFSITQSADSVTDFGFETTPAAATASQVSTTMKLSELGLTPDADGNYNFGINDVEFSFAADTTIRDMMKAVNVSKAGVKISYTTLTNTFTIASNEYGNGGAITTHDSTEGLLTALGFDGSATFTRGENLNLTINGVEVETASNSYEVDGTKFTFTGVSEGTTFTDEVSRDDTKAIDAIKSFVEDYNALVALTYGYTDQEPDDKYYFLTDSDLEDMDLSETQEEKWNTAAKKGILYNDSTLTTLMSKFRTALYTSVDSADGTKFGLYSMGITTSDNWADHGKLTIDEKALKEAFAEHGDDISSLFTNKTNGIMQTFDTILDSAVKTTGAREEKGLLVQKAGVTATSSATDNQIYDQIKSIKTLLDSLQDRYDEQQDRYWARFSNMETQLSKLNQQTSSISQLLGS